MMARMMPTTARIFAMWAESLAIPLKPKMAATMAMMKKMMAQENMDSDQCGLGGDAGGFKVRLGKAAAPQETMRSGSGRPASYRCGQNHAQQKNGPQDRFRDPQR